MGYPSYRKPQWYKKRTDAEAMYIAEQCGVGDVYKCIGLLVPAEEIGEIRKILDLRPEVFNELFPPAEPGW